MLHFVKAGLEKMSGGGLNLGERVRNRLVLLPRGGGKRRSPGGLGRKLTTLTKLTHCQAEKPHYFKGKGLA